MYSPLFAIAESLPRLLRKGCGISTNEPFNEGILLWQDGGAEGVRTPDLLNAIQALYQLSYDPIRGGGKSKTSPEIVKTMILRFEVAAPDFSLRA